MNRDYLYKLKSLCESITEPFDKEIFACACRVYQDYFNGARADKQVSKDAILESLCNKGLATRKKSQLPNDRKLRERARELLKRGFPLMATSRERGYYIADSCGEIDQPQIENHKRAVSILAIDKGYNKARMFIRGQTSMMDKQSEGDEWWWTK